MPGWTGAPSGAYAVLAWFDVPAVRAFVAVLATSLLALAVDLVGWRIVGRLTRFTRTDLDDRLLALVRRPISVSIVLVGTWYALLFLDPPETARRLVRGALMTTAVIYWARTAFNGSELLVDLLSQRQEKGHLIQRRTAPVFDIAAKVLIIGGLTYFLLLAWGVDVSAWLASAGIVGVAFGFAAKDSLANLFAGVFIIADAPYKIGDVLVLDSGERGRVREIGIRTTRIVTRDDVEIIVPNATMANARIVNLSGGPIPYERVRCPVGVAYGSDIEQVKTILVEIAQRCDPVVKNDPRVAPRVRLRALGESSLNFELLVWVDDPFLRGLCLDGLYCGIVKRFAEEGIKIPYPHRVVIAASGAPVASD